MGNFIPPGRGFKKESPYVVVNAETAVPVFIGLTERAGVDTELLLKPVGISSMSEYIRCFGGAPVHRFRLCVTEVEPDDDRLSVYDRVKKIGLKAEPESRLYTLYYHMMMFFANGGGRCYVVSAGNYGQRLEEVYAAEWEMIFSNLDAVADITLLVVPEAVLAANGMTIYRDMLAHCEAKKRFAILDIPLAGDGPVERFRNDIGPDHLSFGAAYYPWLETSVLTDWDITGEMLLPDTGTAVSEWSPFFSDDRLLSFVRSCFDRMNDDGERGKVKNELHNGLMQNWPEYQKLAEKVKAYLNRLPPSAAMAGLYTTVDNTRGVWKAPANLTVNFVRGLSARIDNREQEELSLSLDGKAVNVIRSFTGDGIRVWGARTLDGNSLEWRYINVRRTVSFLEASVRNAAQAFVHERNDANTWFNIRVMIENFLLGIWKRGGLAGPSPEDAYRVHVGLGDTMTPEDILAGGLRIKVLAAVSHPCEFVEICIELQMQTN